MLIMIALGVTTTLTAGILIMASTVGTVQAVGCNHNFDNRVLLAPMESFASITSYLMSFATNHNSSAI